MTFTIDFKSGKPVYLQVVDQVRYAAASGAMRAGEALASVRVLAEELRVNRNTVAKAYAALESLGVIETIGGKGCFLKENQSPLTKEARHKEVLARIDEAVVTAHQMQIGPQVLVGLVEERIRFFERKKGAGQEGKLEEEERLEPVEAVLPPTNSGGGEGWTPMTD